MLDITQWLVLIAFIAWKLIVLYIIYDYLGGFSALQCWIFKKCSIPSSGKNHPPLILIPQNNNSHPQKVVTKKNSINAQYQAKLPLIKKEISTLTMMDKPSLPVDNTMVLYPLQSLTQSVLPVVRCETIHNPPKTLLRFISPQQLQIDFIKQQLDR